MTMRFLFRALLFVFSLHSFNVFAAVISTDLPSNTYVTNHGLDWTWASPVATNDWSGNTLKDPSFHSGWRYATVTEMDYLLTILDLFYDQSGAPIQSVAYWNDPYTHVDPVNWNAGLIASGSIVATGKTWADYYETVYVRDVGEVPIPAAAFLLGPALLGFIGLRRKSK